MPVAIAPRRQWTAHSREDRCTLKVATALLQKTPAELRCVADGLADDDLSEFEERLREIEHRCQAVLSTVQAAQGRVVAMRTGEGQDDSLKRLEGRLCRASRRTLPGRVADVARTPGGRR
jgi:hypothetical protein